MQFFFGLSLGPPAFASALPRQASGPRLRPQKSTFYRALFYAWCFGSSGTEHLFTISIRPIAIIPFQEKSWNDPLKIPEYDIGNFIGKLKKCQPIPKRP